MTGVIRSRAKAGMTIPAAPRMASASLNPEVPKSPAVAILALEQVGRRLSPRREAQEIRIFNERGVW